MTTQFSICIPSYNRSPALASLLNSLQELPLRDTDEVVVVLDGSTDDSRELLTQRATDYPVPLRWEWQPNAGLAAARNSLAALAEGEELWFLDDDMTVTAEAYETHRNVDRSLCDVAFGPSYVVGNEGLAKFYEHRWRELSKRDVIDDPSVVSFANTSIRRAEMRDHPFNEEFRGYGFEDYELALRMMAAGLNFRFAALAKVTHHNDKPALEMLRNVRDEGINRVKMTRLHPEAGAFALEMRPSPIAKILWRMTETGMARLLWAMAVITRLAAKPFTNRTYYRIVRIADDFALHSGVAKGLRAPGVSA